MDEQDTAEKDKVTLPQVNDVPIVGLGASAGGLEALEQFLEHLPADNGLALVIVQHLDPTRPGALPEILQRATPVPVTEVADLTRVEPNHVYVIPPNKDMSILHGILHLFDPAEPRGLRLPIDFFFRSLAMDQQERSIVVILSGMGSDGSLGLLAVKEKAGLVLVQDPASAAFDGMPRSAIATGQVDIVAPAAELPGQLLAYLQHAPFFAAQPLHTREEKTRGALDKIILLLRTATGHDFSQYKKSTLYRRVERRMGLHQIDRIEHYVRYLQENRSEQDLLFKEFLIGVTAFFRDPAAWEQLRTQALPALLADRPADRPLRAWVPACSTGEEAYSLAIVFQEALEQLRPEARPRLQIFATDLDPDAINRARQGFYPTNIAADVSPERLQRFFTLEEPGYRVSQEIRERVTFAPHNALKDPPFTRLDLLSCRNLLIYLTPEVQRKLLALFHYSLLPGGILFLGSAEGTNSLSDLFTPIHSQARLFRRSTAAQPASLVEFPAGVTPPPPAEPEEPPALPVPNLQTLIEHVLTQRYAPAAVLVNRQGNVLYLSGPVDRYLQLPAGQVNWNILAMARPGLRHELVGALALANRQEAPVLHRALRVQVDGEEQRVDLTVQALLEPEGLRGHILVTMAEVAPAPSPDAAPPPEAAAAARIEELEQEVRQLRVERQAVQESYAATTEELQSANEEMQSTNEELTTSREEMQSLNEELQTVNAELQSKVDALASANNDLKNLLDSTDLATVFVDDALQLRRFTPQAARLIRLIPSDVGRSLTDQATDLLYPELATDAHEVLRTLVPVQKEVATRDGRWFSARILPYRTLDNRIDGLVLTFTDISAAKRLEQELREARSEAERLLAARTAELAQSEEQRAQEQSEHQAGKPARGGREGKSPEKKPGAGAKGSARR